MKSIRSGFTLVELIVVIATIGILAAITVIGLTRYQADTRDARRASSIGVISEALEKYYDQNGEYPSCSAVTAAVGTVTTATLKGVSATTLEAPQAPASETNSIKCGTTLTVNGTDFFEYVGDGSAACNGSVSCLGYSLKYKDEASGVIKSLASRRNTSIATSGAATISVDNASFDYVDVSWTAVPNATTYLLQKCTASSCAPGTTTDYTIASGTSSSVTGLSTATPYWFRVRPDASSQNGTWSNIISTTTLSLATPNVVATPDSGSQITVSWGAISGASTYNVDYSTVSNFSSGVVSYTGIATTNKVVTGLSTGVQYFFRVKAINGAFFSSYGTANSYTVIPAPTCSSTVLNSNTQATVSWGAVTGAITYTVEYATNSGYTSPSSISSISTTSQAVTGLNNGTTYYFHVKAVNGSTQSAWGSCPSVTTGVNGPSSVGWSADAYGVRSSDSVAWMPGAYPGGGNWWSNGMYITGTCSPGATVVTRLYSYYAYSNNTSANGATLMDWTWGTQDRYVVGGSGSWWVWWQGWVACQVGSTRAGDTYLGNAGPY